jgi:glycosyltransferase involved in cell wall biosynthesis
MRRFIYWHTYLVVHSEAIMKAMARSGTETVWVADQAMIGDRKGYWDKPPDLPGIEVVVAPDKAKIAELMDKMPEDTVHLFQGFRGHKLVETALPMAKARGLHVGVFSENRPQQGQWSRSRLSKLPISTAFLRKVHYKLEARRSKKGVKFVLVAGYSGPFGGRQFFRSAGFDDEVLYPFGYWMDAPERCLYKSSERPEFHLVFAGQCIPRKAGDVMIDALGRLKDLPWRLTLVGEGPQKANWETQSTSLGIRDRIDFRGALPLEQTHAEMESADAFVLSSHFDGWGMVTAEALTRGVPVICTNRCGSSDLVQQSWRGSILPASDPAAMAEAIAERIKMGRNNYADAERIWNWSKTIDGEHQAEYLKKVAVHAISGGPRPEAHWLNS